MRVRLSRSYLHTYGLERRVRFVSFSGVGGNDVFGLHRLSDYVDGEPFVAAQLPEGSWDDGNICRIKSFDLRALLPRRYLR